MREVYRERTEKQTVKKGQDWKSPPSLSPLSDGIAAHFQPLSVTTLSPLSLLSPLSFLGRNPYRNPPFSSK